jgi:hypothetical protein
MVTSTLNRSKAATLIDVVKRNSQIASNDDFIYLVEDLQCSLSPEVGK